MRTEIPIIRIIAMATPEMMANAAADVTAAGFRYLKLKVGGDLTTDIERVGSVRERCGPKIHLTVDANQAYPVSKAVSFLRSIEQFNIDMVEQPVAADDFDGLKIARTKSSVPILVDESIRSIGDALRIIQMGAAVTV